MSAPFQWIFDNAQQISINNKSVVGQTITRNLKVKATSRGTTARIFSVKLPDGPRWSDIGDKVKEIEDADRFTTEDIIIKATGEMAWLDRGDIDPTETITVICVTSPQWTIFARDQVSWGGSFVFYEVL